MRKLFIDKETKSACDLRERGLHVYAAHPTTDLLCMGWAFDDEEPNIWLPGDPFPDEIRGHVATGGGLVAHNAQFEEQLWEKVGVRKYGWPVIPLEQWNCTMVRSYAMGLPGSLDGAAAAVGISAQKDMAGHRLMLKLSKPRATFPRTDGKGNLVEPEYTWWDDPAELQRLYDYCGQDIRVTQQLDKKLLQLTTKERALWVIDQRINNRGIQVDVPGAEIARVMVDSEQLRLNKEIRERTRNQVATYNAHSQLKGWLQAKGIDTPGVAKADVQKLLSRGDLPLDVRAVLEIRQEAAKSSTAKLKAFVARANTDSRLRGFLQFHGAGTGRWAGRGVQPHNFPRGSLKPEQVEEFFRLLHEKDREMIELTFGSLSTVVSDCLRGFLVASPGHALLAADFSAIEARVVAWLAGEEAVLEVFRTHGKIYEKAAAEIYGVPMEKVAKEQRQIGKVAILALGYQGGVNAFQQMAKGYGVKIAPVADELWARAPRGRREKAKWGWEQRGRKSGIDKREWVGCELIKLAWREANPRIVEYWGEVEEAAQAAVHQPGQKFRAGFVTFLARGSFLFCCLPSGRAIAYAYPSVEPTKTEWGKTRQMLKYKAQNSLTNKWERCTAYGGLLVENITQAVARDILAEALVRATGAGYPVVLHVHDEVVAEHASGETWSLREFEALVAEVPDWAPGLPVKAEGWVGKRYRK